jgi:hypothetical protein
MYSAGFQEFTAMADCLRLDSILGYLDGPLHDVLTEDMDGVLARIQQCAIGYRLRIGRGLCDMAPFGSLLEAIHANQHLFPVCASDYPVCHI